MTLNFQNKIVFPAPESSYTTETAYGQVIYIPRNYLSTPENAEKIKNPKKKEVVGEHENKLHHPEHDPLKNIKVSPSLQSNSDVLGIGELPEIKDQQEVEKMISEVKEAGVIEEVKHEGEPNGVNKGSKGDGSPVSEPAGKEESKENLISDTSTTVSSKSLDFGSFLGFSSSVSQKSSSSIAGAAKDEEPVEYIPCLYMPYDEGASKLVIYFHGNAEDIGLAFDLLYQFGNDMRMHVLAVEYPGYGLYKTSKPNETQMKEDAETIFEYLTKVIGVREQDIILFGRSMGSGPATYLSRKNACACLLMSPYTSIKDVAKSLLGWGSFLSVIVYDRFRNIDLIREAKCPVFFLHGQRDRLIPHSHSEELNSACPTESFIHLPPLMDHNEFDFQEDLINPFSTFLKCISEGTKAIKINGGKSKLVKESKKVDPDEEGSALDSDDRVESFYSPIDKSGVDYVGEAGQFDLYFDQKLYEPPKAVVAHERKLYEQMIYKNYGKKL